MKNICPTIIIQHQKERVKKCSLSPLKGDKDFLFYSYPLKVLPPIDGYVLLSADAPQILSRENRNQGLLLLDGTWKLVKKMESQLEIPETVIYRSLPSGIQTAYLRRQEVENGLASIEALFMAFIITGRQSQGLLDHYYWKKNFLEKNQSLINLNI
ncbi:MAG: DUF367 domain-containing protein [Chlamydiales bacterium]